MSPAADDASALRSEMMLFACALNDAMFAPTCRSTHHALKALIIAEGSITCPSRANIIHKKSSLLSQRGFFVVAAI